MPQESRQPRLLPTSPSPHGVQEGVSTRRIMLDVLIGLAPVVAMSIYLFGWHAARQLGICVAACLAAELAFTWMRRRPVSLLDLTAVITGAVLAMSLPATAPWYVAAIAGVAAVGIGKAVFGGLGQNLFNPAMVGRAFVMLAFTTAMAAEGYKLKPAGGGGHEWEAATRSTAEPAAPAGGYLTQATPLSAWRFEGKAAGLGELFLGTTNGSLGETSAAACLLGGLFLCLRRAAAWQIPLGVLLAAGAVGGGIDLACGPAAWNALHHLLGGAMMFGAFFVATDPVTSPLTGRGKFVFGLGVGGLAMLIRTRSSWPEGVMFAVLLMNALVPLIDRWTIPRPLGGPVPAPPKEAAP